MYYHYILTIIYTHIYITLGVDFSTPCFPYHWSNDQLPREDLQLHRSCGDAGPSLKGHRMGHGRAMDLWINDFSQQRSLQRSKKNKRKWLWKFWKLEI